MRRTWVVILAIAIVAAVGVYIYVWPSAMPEGTLTINGQPIQVQIADTAALRMKGLSGRSALPADHGMLFVFDHDGYISFWMKDMKFPIDILWLSSIGTVVHVQENVSPTTYPESFTSTSTARFVLELPAHYVSAHHVKVGDTAVLP